LAYVSDRYTRVINYFADTYVSTSARAKAKTTTCILNNGK